MTKTHLGEKFRRYRQIGDIVAKHGFGIIFERTHLVKFLRLHLRKAPAGKNRALPARIRAMLEDLGPTFVKFGQILSTRPDLVPFEFIKEFEKLQDEVKPIPPDEVETLLRQELDKPAAEIFKSFDKTPIASASVSQVHRAVLKNGEAVAVKIQRPGIEKTIQLDLQILRDIAVLIRRFIKEAELYQPVRIVEEFERVMKKELDFSVEARNIERFRNNFAGEETVYVPRVYREMSTRKMLTLEYIEGVKVNRLDMIGKWGLDRRELAVAGARAALKQIFADGFFHADPHPGNIFVLKSGKLCYLDFGIVGKLDETRKIDLLLLLHGFLGQDSEKVIGALSSMNAIGPHVDTRELRREIDDTVDRYYDVSMKDIRIRDVMEEGFEVMRRFDVRVPADLSLLAKALITTEGVGLVLDPEFNFTAEMQPFLKNLLVERFKLTNIVRRMGKNLESLYFLSKEVPAILESLFRHIKRGSLNITFEHEGLKDFIITMDKASSRISFSLIIAALLVASSLIMTSGKGDLWLGFPVIGVMGYAIAGLMGLWLLVSILRGMKP